MKTPYEMSYFLAFGFIGFCILFGVFLRGKIKFFQRFLVPASMIGGIAGMVVINLRLIPLDMELFQAIAYHFFIISFISIGLTGTDRQPGQKGHNKEIFRGALWMGLMNGASMTTQAFLGCVLILAMGLAGLNLPLQVGLFLPLGFTQGPGQALAVGKAWEAAGLTNAISIGLAFAAIGFFFALFVGIPLVNWGIRRGFTRRGRAELPDYFLKGYYGPHQVDVPTGMMTTHPGNVDSFAFQGAVVGTVYMLTYLLYFALEKALGALSSATWGFFFFYGMVVALIVRWLMNRMTVGHLLNPQTQIRLTSWAVDVLVTATLIGVKLSVVWDYIVPIMIIALAGGLWTTFSMLYFGRRLPNLGFERMIAQYGCNTGTVSTGLLLLRVVDPEFKTTATLETGLYPIIATPFILGTMLVIVYSQKWGLTVYHQMGIYLGLTIIALALLKIFKLWGKKAW